MSYIMEQQKLKSTLTYFTANKLFIVTQSGLFSQQEGEAKEAAQRSEQFSQKAKLMVIAIFRTQYTCSIMWNTADP